MDNTKTSLIDFGNNKIQKQEKIAGVQDAFDLSMNKIQIGQIIFACIENDDLKFYTQDEKIKDYRSTYKYGNLFPPKEFAICVATADQTDDGVPLFVVPGKIEKRPIIPLKTAVSSQDERQTMIYNTNLMHRFDNLILDNFLSDDNGWENTKILRLYGIFKEFYNFENDKKRNEMFNKYLYIPSIKEVRLFYGNRIRNNVIFDIWEANNVIWSSTQSSFKDAENQLLYKFRAGGEGELTSSSFCCYLAPFLRITRKNFIIQKSK